MTELEGWVTSEVAHEITNLSRTTLYIYRVSNRLRWQKFGRTIMYWKGDLEQIVREREQKQKSPGQF